MDLSPAYTPETLGAVWGVSAATVRNLIHRGDLRGFRVGRQFRIRPQAVEEFEARQASGSPTGKPERRPAPAILSRRGTS
jgi:excisionase family DNA binding protein